jgi:hypothetical protein
MKGEPDQTCVADSQSVSSSDEGSFVTSRPLMKSAPGSMMVLEGMEGDMVSSDLERSPAQTVTKQVKSRIEVSRTKTTTGDGKKVYKIAVVGNCNSGKSTMVKQFKMLFAEGLRESERILFQHTIVTNTLQSFTAVLKAMDSLGIDFENPENEVIYSCALVVVANL